MDIHNYDQRYPGAREYIEKSELSPQNKKLILTFADDLSLENISKPRIIRYMETLKKLARDMKCDFDNANVEDLKRAVSIIQQNPKYSPWTKHTYKILIRRFYKWLKKTEDYPEEVKWLKSHISRSETKLPCEGDLLTEPDIQKLIAAANHPRDKALISTLWESGARIGEVGNLQIKHVVFDKFGTVITVKGKTGSRKIRLISSTPYLSTWINNHPFKVDNNSAVWINIGSTNHFKVMHYRTIRIMLLRLKTATGITKRINPHTFRHSRATFMANHLTEFQMNQYFGWIQGSDMPSTYVHMSGKEVDNAILEMNGIKNTEKKEMEKPTVCPRCDTINAICSKHCNKCGGILDLRAAMEIEERMSEVKKARSTADQFMDLLWNDKRFQNLLEQITKERESC